MEQLDGLSFGLERVTVVVLDNAPAHVARLVKERKPFWQARGLFVFYFVFYLPCYCPHLNIAEVLWRKLKYQWLRPQDYLDTQTLFYQEPCSIKNLVLSRTLFYQVRQALAAVGSLLKIHFAPFQHKLT